MRLGVNIDHVATLRETRGTSYPDPVSAALMAESAGCHLITCHLREDRRHIKDHDLFRLKNKISTELNLEMSANPAIVKVARRLRPAKVTIVPEKRRELTTEGGLDVIRLKKRLRDLISMFHELKVRVSLFIEPRHDHVDASKEIGTDEIEIHTGGYANSTGSSRNSHLKKIKQAAQHGSSLGLLIAAGHGLNYDNVRAIAKIASIKELNIGHSIVAKAVYCGFYKATREMLALINANK